MSDEEAIRADTLSARMHGLLRLATAPAPLAPPAFAAGVRGDETGRDEGLQDDRGGHNDASAERPGG